MPLVEPLLNVISEEDLLVLCLTDVLPGIPIHAALVESFDKQKAPNEHKILIERNPIVYTFSMTTFSQCTLRSFGGRNRSLAQAIVIGVYEDAEDGTPLDASSCERQEVYSLCQDIAERNQWPQAICGHETTRENFASRCDANIIHLTCHYQSSADTNSQNIFTSGILLGDGQSQVRESISGDSSSDSTFIGPPQVSDRIFWVEDIFHHDFKASHISLIACNSATSYTTKGDEPLGFVSALLCRVVNSVLATSWKIPSSSGRACSSRFYGAFDFGAPKPVDLAMALQNTVKSIREEKIDMQAPYHWAGYALHGTWHLRPGEAHPTAM